MCDSAAFCCMRGVDRQRPAVAQQLASPLLFGGFTTIGPTFVGLPSPRAFRPVSRHVYDPPTVRFAAESGLSVLRTLWPAPPFEDVHCTW